MEAAFSDELRIGQSLMGHGEVSRGVQEILDGLAEAAVVQTPFRRALVSLYERPIGPSGATRVLACGSRGLSEGDQAMIRAALREGREISGERFSPEYLVGSSYFIPQGSFVEELGPRVVSRRIFLRPDGWRRHDVLLTPMRAGEQFIGAISVDDPRDGAFPEGTRLGVLERLAGLGEAALRRDSAPGGAPNADREALFAALAEHCMAGLLVTREERVEYANRRVLELFGYNKGELQVMRPWWQLIHPEDRRQLMEGDTARKGIRARAVRKDGSSVWVLVRSYVMEFDGQQAHLVDLWDISEQVETEGALKQKALRDPLTGLFNRHYFDETIRAELKRAQRYGRSFTLVVADLQGFKRVNDRLGHTKGDDVLRSIASILKDALRESDWLVRYGGDEFLVVLPETASPVDVVLQRLQSAVEAWSREHLPDIRISLDVGWATWSPGCGRSVRDLLKAADAQMYEAKRTDHRPEGEG
ncbi:MAG: sensor domain-containing diguanylate cyclase [Candidatus Bipolaricaulota bacterium]